MIMWRFEATWIAILLWWSYRQERIPEGYEEGEYAHP
jgi:hypothetical protein